MYSQDTLLSVSSFTRQQDGEEIIIGRLDTGIFLAIPQQAVEVLDHLAEGRSIGEVTILYQQKYGEIPDLRDFLELMEAKGIVQPVETQNRTTVPNPAPPPQLRYHFSRFPESLARRLFSYPALAIYGIVVASAMVLVMQDKTLAPQAADLYFPSRRTVSWTILLAVNFATLFIHEFGHLVAARALGLNSHMGIGHRLWFLVGETDLTGLWSIPRSKRYLPLLAGSIIDAFSGALLIIVLFSYNHGWVLLPGLCLRLVRAMAFIYVMRLVWQCFFFVRTDFYYVIISAFNCKNLMGDTEAFLRNAVARYIPWIGSIDQTAIPASERRVVRVFAVAWVAGRIAAFALLFMVTIPVSIRYIENIKGVLKSGYSANPYNFIDALLLAMYFFVPLTAGLTMWINGLLRRIRS
jgi:putative peptide zinc metalloprotease protein